MFFINNKDTKDLIAQMEHKVSQVLKVDTTTLMICTASNSEVMYGIEFVFQSDEDDTYSTLTIMDGDFHLCDVFEDYMQNGLVKWYKKGIRFYINNVIEIKDV